MTAVFGDFLRPAGEHIAAAVAIQHELAAEATFGVIGHFGRLLSTFAGYLDSLPVPDEFEAAMAEGISPQAQTALDARIALRRGAHSMRHAMTTLGTADIDDAHPAAQHLSAAADLMAAGRDLLQTHFATGPAGTREDHSPWAPVIISPPVTAALLSELADYALRLAPWTARLSVTATMGRDAPAATCLALLTASHSAWVAGATIQAAHRHHPPPPQARRLLGAIPANFPPPRQAPSSGEQLPDLCHGVVVTAERLRHATLAVPRHAYWSPAATSAAWRKHALAAAITGHASDLILRALAERATQLAASPAICEQLHEAADATRQAWPAWRAIAHHFDIVSTGITGRPGPDPVAADFTDLVLRIGRLAYHNPHWTPARAHASHPRDPAGLAPTPLGLTPVLAAVHAAADATARITATDSQTISAAATEHRLYEPAFTRTNATVIRRRYHPACPSRIAEILASYDDAITVSNHAASKLDDLAHALDAPTWPLAALRTPAPRIPRPFQPGETTAHGTRPRRQPARTKMGARVRT
jgi:hypothetical protein